MKITRRYTVEDLKGNKVSRLDVYEDYVTEYLLDFAERIARSEHSEIAVLVLLTSIFEPLGTMIRGPRKGTDSDRFCAGLEFVFGPVPGSPAPKSAAARIYRLLRHGLYHEGFLKSGLVLVAEGEPIAEDNGILRINVGAFLRKTAQRFHAYIEGVRRSGEGSMQTRNFIAFWEETQDLHSPTVSMDWSSMPDASTAAPISRQFVKKM